MIRKKLLCLAGPIALVLFIGFFVKSTLADGKEDARWEGEEVGIDFASWLEQTPQAYFPRSRFVVTTILPRPEQQQIWVGTTDGICICRSDGTFLQHILAGRSPDLREKDTFYWGRMYVHGHVRAMIPLSDNSIWVRTLWGGFRMDSGGEMLQEYHSDKDVVERQYKVILREPALQRYFPTVDGKVYLPLAGRKIAEYDGQEWTLLSNPASSLELLPYRLHVIGDYLYLVEPGGVRRVTDGKLLIESSGSEIKRIRDDTWLCVGDGVWILEGEKPRRIQGTVSWPQGVDLYKLASGDLVWSCYDSSLIYIVEVPKGQMRSLVLPEGHRFRGFSKISQTGREHSISAQTGLPDQSDVYVLTSQGVIWTDLRTCSELLNIKTPSVPYPWDLLTTYGIHVWTGLKQDQEILLGTSVGLARYELELHTLRWMWRVSD